MSYEVVDEILTDCQIKANAPRLLSVQNMKALWRHFKETGEVLEFEYPKIPYDPLEVEKVVDELIIPEGTLQELYESKRHQTKLLNAIVKHRGNSEKVKALSKELWGSPSNKLVKFAELILHEKVTAPEKGESSAFVKETMENALVKYGIKGWRVEYAKKFSTSVNRAEKRISISEDRTFNKGDAARLCAHEIGVHVLRAWNGSLQKHKLFLVGCPNYLSTEEGLAVYCEELSGTRNPADMRKYAARVLGVHYMEEGLSIPEAWSQLMEFPAYEDSTGYEPFTILVRVYRGGGMSRDHVYLQGYMDVKNYHELGGDLSILWVGKIGLDQIALVERLIADEELVPPQVVPEFIK